MEISLIGRFASPTMLFAVPKSIVHRSLMVSFTVDLQMIGLAARLAESMIFAPTSGVETETMAMIGDDELTGAII